ncbi:hypothetical protein NLG07_04930 [Alteromonas sp. LMIT006]|jgi:glucosamine kinase|uniref:BadF/BadG/BcrA/BcrD ATPase family protein n=1 Tax=Alteromonadaceae TaxID=72275 RepID=UPI0020CA6D1C|nr:BadF/BadG/BcrA/BcrD ATPase family protein [Alteromonas sp. LMIT006]UTP73585.1 hypothetical protein NLG07_04930 [Alteromonas sp. LMIT006]
MASNHPPIIAIDGGGTSCDAALFIQNTCIDKVVTGPANVYVDPSRAQQNIVAAVSELASRHDLGLDQILVSGGCAGMGIATAQQEMQKWQSPFCRLALTTDVHVASLGANLGADCHTIIVGTGSCALTLHQGELTQTGGHGCLLGDDASGAWLGQELLRYCLLASDGLTETSELIEAGFAFIGTRQAAEIVSRYHTLDSAILATLAPLVFEHVGEDELANHLVAQGVDYLVHLHGHLDAQMALPSFAYGSIWNAYKKCNIEELTVLQTPLSDPLHGAYLYGLSAFGFQS